MKTSERVDLPVGIGLKLVTSPDVTVPKQKLRSPADGAALFRPLFDGEAVESLWVAGLSATSMVVGVARVATGSYTYCEVDPRILFASLLLMGPVSAFVLCHNHPSGDPTPSTHDIQLTRQLRDAGRALCLRLSDHIIIGEGHRFVSMLGEGLFDEQPTVSYDPRRMESKR